MEDEDQEDSAAARRRKGRENGCVARA